MSSIDPKPTGREEVKRLKDKVSGIFTSNKLGIASEIIFVSQGTSNNRDIPLAEVRMSSKTITVRLRKSFVLRLRESFAQKKKLRQDFGRVYISNCVTLVTRVRLEILEAMNQKFTSVGKTSL